MFCNGNRAFWGTQYTLAKAQMPKVFEITEDIYYH